MNTLQNVLHLGTSYIILKVSKKNRSRLVLGKERETQGKNERDMEGKEGRKGAVETNLVHSGLYKINK